MTTNIASIDARPSRPSGSISLLARLLLIALGLLAPLALLEIVLRVAGPILPGDYQTASFVETHPAFGRRNKPGSGWKKTPEFTTWIEVNSKGLRGPEIEFAKPPGEKRILVLGDSFTFAEQVNQNESFVQRLNDQLNEQSSNTRYTVLNAGSNGWATANELIYLVKEGLRYSPDIIVVAYYVGNDTSDNFRRVAAVRDAERADLELRGNDPFEATRRIARMSELYTLFESGVLAKLPQPPSSESSDAAIRAAPKTADDAQEAWDITEGLLHRVNQVARTQGVPAVLMVIPSADQVAAGSGGRQSSDDEDDEDQDSGPIPGFENPQATLAEIATRQSIPYLDLLPALRRQATRSRGRLFYRVNAHFTAAGHAIAAQELYQFLAAAGLVPSR